MCLSDLCWHFWEGSKIRHDVWHFCEIGDWCRSLLCRDFDLRVRRKSDLFFALVNPDGPSFDVVPLVGLVAAHVVCSVLLEADQLGKRLVIRAPLNRQHLLACDVVDLAKED